MGFACLSIREFMTVDTMLTIVNDRPERQGCHDFTSGIASTVHQEPAMTCFMLPWTIVCYSIIWNHRQLTVFMFYWMRNTYTSYTPADIEIPNLLLVLRIVQSWNKCPQWLQQIQIPVFFWVLQYLSLKQVNAICNSISLVTLISRNDHLDWTTLEKTSVSISTG